MEEEARVILRDALAAESAPPAESLAQAVRGLFAPLGGTELELPPREPVREPVREPPDLAR